MNIEDVKHLLGSNTAEVGTTIKYRMVFWHIKEQLAHTPKNYVVAYFDDKNIIVKLVQDDKFCELSTHEDVIISNLNYIINPLGFKLYKIDTSYILKDITQRYRLYTSNELAHFKLSYFEPILLKIVDEHA